MPLCWSLNPYHYRCHYDWPLWAEPLVVYEPFGCYGWDHHYFHSVCLPRPILSHHWCDVDMSIHDHPRLSHDGKSVSLKLNLPSYVDTKKVKYIKLIFFNVYLKTNPNPG